MHRGTGRRALAPPPRVHPPAVRAAPRRRRGTPWSPSLLESRLDAFALGLPHQTLVLGVVDSLGVFDQQVGDVAVEHAVPALQPLVVQRLLVGEVEQRALVLRARKNLEQLRVECHVPEDIYSDRTIPKTSAVCCSHVVASGASRFRRSNGSVLLGRRLNHHGPQSTVSPSRRSCGHCANASATRSITARGSSTRELISPLCA